MAEAPDLDLPAAKEKCAESGDRAGRARHADSSERPRGDSFAGHPGERQPAPRSPARRRPERAHPEVLP